MSGSNVLAGGALPLIRTPTISPGQMGVEGTDTETGLRLSSTGTIFYVDPNYPGASTSADGTLPTNPFSTITAAIGKCESYRNDVIIVGMNAGYQDGPGTPYATPIQESATLDKHGVRLIGVGPSMGGVPWGPGAAGETCLTITGSECTVEGFLFTGDVNAGDGIYAEWSGAGTALWGDNLTIRHCTFDDDIDTAIQLEFVWFADIWDCLFTQCDEYGIFVDSGGSGIRYAHIHNNWFQDCALGAIFVEHSERGKIEYNNIYNSTAVAAGASVDLGITTDDGSDNIVAHNVLSCLLPVPANGDYDDFCTSDHAAPNTSDVWINNFCLDGQTTTNPT